MKIAILDDYQNVARVCADWSGLDVTVFNDPIPEDQLAERLADFEIISIMRERTPFPKSLFDALPNLKLLVTTGARNAAIDMEGAKANGVTVCGTRSPGHATAELTWGLILSSTRNIPDQVQSVRTGGWQLGLGEDLRGKTIGIIGLGRLGAQVATIAQAFGMKVITWSRNMTQDKASLHGAEAVSKETLFQRSDIITIHMKYSPTIKHLVGQEELDLMKSTARLINTSRAPIIDTEALIHHLETGKIAGAALDVHDLEPLPSTAKIRTTPNLIATPHIGYVTKETYEIFYGESVEVIRSYLKGGEVAELI